jgi:hypothetical protein
MTWTVALTVEVPGLVGGVGAALTEEASSAPPLSKRGPMNSAPEPSSIDSAWPRWAPAWEARTVARSLALSKAAARTLANASSSLPTVKALGDQFARFGRFVERHLDALGRAVDGDLALLDRVDVDAAGADVPFADAGEGFGGGDHLAQARGGRLQGGGARLPFALHAEADLGGVVRHLEGGRGGDGDGAAGGGARGGGEERAGGEQRGQGQDEG